MFWSLIIDVITRLFNTVVFICTLCNSYRKSIAIIDFDSHFKSLSISFLFLNIKKMKIFLPFRDSKVSLFYQDVILAHKKFLVWHWVFVAVVVI